MKYSGSKYREIQEYLNKHSNTCSIENFKKIVPTDREILTRSMHNANTQHGNSFDLLGFDEEYTLPYLPTIQLMPLWDIENQILIYTEGKILHEGYTGLNLNHGLSFVLKNKEPTLAFLHSLRKLEQDIEKYHEHIKWLLKLSDLLEQENSKILLFDASSKKGLTHKLTWLNHLIAQTFGYQKGCRLSCCIFERKTRLALLPTHAQQNPKILEQYIALYNNIPSRLKKLAPVVSDIMQTIPPYIRSIEIFLVGIHTVRSGLVEYCQTVLNLDPYLAYNADLTLQALS